MAFETVVFPFVQEIKNTITAKAFLLGSCIELYFKIPIGDCSQTFVAQAPKYRLLAAFLE